MADKCFSCNQTVTTRQQAIQCDGCLKWNHRTCNTGKWNFFFFFLFIQYVLKDHSLLLAHLWNTRCATCFDNSFFNFFIGITQQAYREAVRVGADISWFCLPCQPGSPVAESSRISEQSTDILESSEFNPRAYHSDLLQSTIYDAPAQSTTVSLERF